MLHGPSQRPMMRALAALDRLTTDELLAFHREVCARAHTAYAATELYQQHRAAGIACSRSKTFVAR